MVRNHPAFQKTVKSLWTGRAAVIIREGCLNPATGRTDFTERILADDLPCRISYKAVKSAEPVEEAAAAGQTVTLYTAPDLEIPDGSRITVTQNGVTRDYVRSGRAAVYRFHQEVPLELWKEWA